ncbi:alpha/beta hydrolase family protein [Pendulispora albinea]|uniref:Alpha/beta hydrolase family protein n=1 Tax=Pendulispora albinea TaxID=2741071 RepID=A0ABZ2MCL2_9BACT
MLRAHWLDYLLSLVMARRPLFGSGWGDSARLDRFLMGLGLEEPPEPLAIAWSPSREYRGFVVRDGTFESPIAELPHAAHRGHLRALLPRRQRFARPRAMYVSLAGSGEEGFAVRLRLFGPLVEHFGIGVLLLENPFYGLRRPPGQRGSAIRTVSEHMLMNLAMVKESLGLLESLAEQGHTRLGVTGFSMGGAMAALTAAITPRPVAVAIFCAGRAPKYAFTRGLLTRSIDFEHLGLTEGGREAARGRLRRLFATADLDRHPVPRCPKAAVIVGARHDGYVSPEEVQRLHELWKGSEVRWLDTGHVGAMLRHTVALRRAAVDAIDRLVVVRREDTITPGTPSVAERPNCVSL